jgi:hypothetical protein
MPEQLTEKDFEKGLRLLEEDDNNSLNCSGGYPAIVEMKNHI